MSAKPRILFFGYSEVGYSCLSLLLERGDNVVALITHEDNPHEKIWFKTPAVAAREKEIPVFTPESVNTPEWREKIAALRPDLILSVYYRHMIGPSSSPSHRSERGTCTVRSCQNTAVARRSTGRCSTAKRAWA